VTPNQGLHLTAYSWPSE